MQPRLYRLRSEPEHELRYVFGHERAHDAAIDFMNELMLDHRPHRLYLELYRRKWSPVTTIYIKDGRII